MAIAHALHRFPFAPEKLWPLLADTARFNEAVGLPKHEIIETPQPDGSVDFQGRLKKGPVTLSWRERPVNWVSNEWFEHHRDFLSGPLASLTAKLTLKKDGEGCLADYAVEVLPKSLLGRLLAPRIAKGGIKNFTQAAEAATRHLAGESQAVFDYAASPPSDAVKARVAEQVKTIEQSRHGHGLAAKLAEEILGAQEVDLAQIRPLKLARLWQAPPLSTIELCLEATRAGLLDLKWSLLCPRCRVAKASATSLDALPKGTHCGSCNIDYGRDFTRNVELAFQPSPAIRPIVFGEYCLFGPLSTPHVKAQIALLPGEEKEISIGLKPGPYRYRTLAPGPEVEVEVAGAPPALIIGDDDLTAGAPTKEGALRLVNLSKRPQIAVIEERHWVADALTADRVATLQAFRDLFSDQVLRPGDEVSVGEVTLLFTDLRASTALYRKIGDASAYHLVRDHFAFLAGLVRAREGAIVKTIGDAIMAAFKDPAQAVTAALAMQRGLAHFNAEHESAQVALKVGLHKGPSIAVTMNERLDYFGSTVNLAARLQGQSQGGDIVLSKTLAEDPSVAPLLAGFPARQEAADLKGFDQPIAFLRLSVS